MKATCTALFNKQLRACLESEKKSEEGKRKEDVWRVFVVHLKQAAPVSYDAQASGQAFPLATTPAL